jgi:hypothetical protein
MLIERAADSIVLQSFSLQVNCTAVEIIALNMWNYVIHTFWAYVSHYFPHSIFIVCIFTNAIKLATLQHRIDNPKVIFKLLFVNTISVKQLVNHY